MGQSLETLSCDEPMVVSCIEPSSPNMTFSSLPLSSKSTRCPSDDELEDLSFSLDLFTAAPMHNSLYEVPGTPALSNTSSDLHLDKPRRASELFVEDFGLVCDDSDNPLQVEPLGSPVASKAWAAPWLAGRRRSLKAVGQFIVMVLRFQLTPSKRRSYERDLGVAADSIELIDMDLPRSCMLGSSASTHTGRIRAVLLRHLAEDPELGYCQGMHLVAAVFSKASGSQDEAYLRFHRFMGRARGLWVQGFPLLRVGTAQLEVVAKNRPWYGHLLEKDVESSMFLPQALMTMFTMWLPLETVVECLALVESEGLKAMVAIALAILDDAANRLLAQQSLEGILGVLQELPKHPLSAEALLAAASRNLQDVSRALPRPPQKHPGAASPRSDGSCTEAGSPRRLRSYTKGPHAGSITESATEMVMEPL
mmetsp:Transcript_53018/g.105318  ORF Transcript_53018/g.105318 Transcript_53018/m.105318 type:complete len:423 (-) Transcript_53018:74-1342(-)